MFSYDWEQDSLSSRSVLWESRVASMLRKQTGAEVELREHAYSARCESEAVPRPIVLAVSFYQSQIIKKRWV